MPPPSLPISRPCAAETKDAPYHQDSTKAGDTTNLSGGRGPCGQPAATVVSNAVTSPHGIAPLGGAASTKEVLSCPFPLLTLHHTSPTPRSAATGSTRSSTGRSTSQSTSPVADGASTTSSRSSFFSCSATPSARSALDHTDSLGLLDETSAFCWTSSPTAATCPLNQLSASSSLSSFTCPQSASTTSTSTVISSLTDLKWSPLQLRESRPQPGAASSARGNSTSASTSASGSKPSGKRDAKVASSTSPVKHSSKNSSRESGSHAEGEASSSNSRSMASLLPTSSKFSKDAETLEAAPVKASLTPLRSTSSPSSSAEVDEAVSSSSSQTVSTLGNISTTQAGGFGGSPGPSSSATALETPTKTSMGAAALHGNGGSRSSNGSPLADAIEVVPGKLYWLTLTRNITFNVQKVHLFCVDDVFVYEPFFADFGPLNLGHTYRYCKLLENKLIQCQQSGKAAVHCVENDAQKLPNAAYLIGAFQIVVLGYTAEEAYRPFQQAGVSFRPFRDATYGQCTYELTVLDSLRGLEFAISLGWFPYSSFDIEEYEFHERVENGDLNWIIPNKFVAFSGPCGTATDEDGLVALTPEDYVGIFKKLGVRLVIRLNKKQYDKKVFTSQGINHVDLYFLDGSCPSRDLIQKFLDLTEKEPGAVAVHCKAGLGRTGTLIGCYAIKNYGFPAAYWIGWNRICRPGSVLGPQQHFLNSIQDDLMRMGVAPNLNPPVMSTHAKATSEKPTAMGPNDKRVAEHGDLGQGERLVNARRHGRSANSNNLKRSESASGSGAASNGGRFASSVNCSRDSRENPRSRESKDDESRLASGSGGKPGAPHSSPATSDQFSSRRGRDRDH